MRKAVYFATLAVVALTLVLNIVSLLRSDWLVVKSDEVLYTTITTTYGLTKRCELTESKIPSDKDKPGKGGLSYRNYECRKFPMHEADKCDGRNRDFCALWSSAGFLDDIAVGFGVVSILAILFGLSTRSRRRRIWRAAACLVCVQAACQILTFAFVTYLYARDRYPSFEHAKPGRAYVAHIFTWVLNVIAVIAIAVAGMAADQGHRWAVGNAEYQPILSGNYRD